MVLIAKKSIYARKNVSGTRKSIKKLFSRNSRGRKERRRKTGVAGGAGVAGGFCSFGGLRGGVDEGHYSESYLLINLFVGGVRVQ